MKNLLKKMAISAFLAIGASHAAFNGVTGQIGLIYSNFDSGKLTTVQANVYDYVGGTFRYWILPTDYTSGIPAKQDLNELNKMIQQAFTNWDKVAFSNYTGNDGRVYSGNSFMLTVRKN